MCEDAPLCGGSADGQEDSMSPETSGFAFLQEQGDVTARDKELAQGPPLLVDCELGQSTLLL